MKQCKIEDKETSFPDALNVFYARFEQNASCTVMPALTAPDTPVPLCHRSRCKIGLPGSQPKENDGHRLSLRLSTQVLCGPAGGGPQQTPYSLALQSSLEHLDNKDTHIRLLFVDYSSTFNTIIPSRLISKLRHFGLGFILCNWILSFLTHRPQSSEDRRLREFGMFIRSLTNFYRCAIESILSGCITAWYSNCSTQDCKKLQKVVCTAQTITEANLPSM
eukprot:g27680.t1